MLTSKLSGLDLNDGRARGGDSGVVRTQDLKYTSIYKQAGVVCTQSLTQSSTHKDTYSIPFTITPETTCQHPDHVKFGSNKVILQVSPSEASTEGERERLLSETNSKTRSHSGEDAGIGSEQGELQLPVEIFLGK